MHQISRLANDGGDDDDDNDDGNEDDNNSGLDLTRGRVVVTFQVVGAEVMEQRCAKQLVKPRLQYAQPQLSILENKVL